MCSWERFCASAREPETRKVAVDARVSVAGVRYAVDPDLAGETVTLWFGLYDDQLYVEHGDNRYGPYAPIDGPIPLHRYRSFKKTRSQQLADTPLPEGPNIEKLPYGATCSFSCPDRRFQRSCGTNFAEKDARDLRREASVIRMSIEAHLSNFS